MKLSERSQAELVQAVRDAVVYVYTPLCGTCKAGERMMEVVAELAGTSPGAPEFVKLNVNYAYELAKEWRIESVPCMIRIKEGRLAGKRYRLGGADELLHWVNGESRSCEQRS